MGILKTFYICQFDFLPAKSATLVWKKITFDTEEKFSLPFQKYEFGKGKIFCNISSRNHRNIQQNSSVSKVIDTIPLSRKSPS